MNDIKPTRTTNLFFNVALASLLSSVAAADVVFDTTLPSIQNNSTTFSVTSSGIIFSGSNPSGDATERVALTNTNVFPSDGDGLFVGDDDLTSFEFSFDSDFTLQSLDISVNGLDTGSVALTWENTVTSQSTTVNVPSLSTGAFSFPTPVAFAAGQLGRFTSGGTPVGYSVVQMSSVRGIQAIPEPSASTSLGLVLVGMGICRWRRNTRASSTVVVRDLPQTIQQRRSY